MTDQRNLILAIVLSILILLGFQFFLAPPSQDSDQPTAGQAEDGGPATNTDTVGLTDGGPVVGETAGTGVDGTGLVEGGGQTAVSRETALEETPRVLINTERPGNEEGALRGVSGSISLRGGNLDDLTLAGYRETVDPDSPEIVLLSPRGSPHPYLVDVGFTDTEGTPLTTPDTLWEADREEIGANQPVTLRHELDNGLTLERIYQVDENYMFTVTERVTNTTDEPVTLTPYSRVLRYGTPDTLGYFILHEGPYGVFDGTLEEYDYDDLSDDDNHRVDYDSTGGWLGFTDKYWLVAIVPDQDRTMHASFIYNEHAGESRYYAVYRMDDVTVEPGETAESVNHVFAGAKEVALIDQYQDDYGIDNFELAIDFGWFYFLTRPFFTAIAWIHSIVGNFGIAILIFTVCLKLLFFPLANKSYRAMSKMKALQPEMTKIRERYGDDRQKQQQEIMALYRREKVSPASGCLPILIQIPVFFALYKVLFVTIEMRHAPFFGWIQDLSAPDPTTVFNLFGLIPWEPPSMLMIGVWPLIMGVTMFLQQRVNPAPADPVQQKIFMMLPIVFTFVLARFPAGLVIYWAWNNSLSILQQVVIMKRMGVKIGGGRVARAKSLAAVHTPNAGDNASAAKSGRKKVWADASDSAAASEGAGEAEPAGNPGQVSPPRPKKGQARGQQNRRRAGTPGPRRR
ncbi:MAG: membrane protein insertase YidC [Rhodospirillaceae bacterium]|nr:membrane protein insertase YidC [Rhodospirillaceae bacterium]